MQVKFILTNRFWTRRRWSENFRLTELEVISLNEKIDYKNKNNNKRKKNKTFRMPLSI